MTREDTRIYMREFADQEGWPASCASTPELVDYLRGIDKPASRESIQFHLLTCVECTETLLQLADFTAALEQQPTSVPRATQERWRELRRLIRSSEKPRRWWSGSFSGFFRPAFSAACALCAVVAFSWGVVVQQKLSLLQNQYGNLLRQQTDITVKALRVQSELALARAPQVNLPVFDVLPGGDTVRSLDSRQTNVFALPAAGRFALVLGGAAQQREAEYLIEVSDAGRKVVFSSPGLRPDSQGNLVVTFERGFLRAGPYSVGVLERSDENWTPVARYAIRLTDQPPSPKTAAAAQ